MRASERTIEAQHLAAPGAAQKSGPVRARSKLGIDANLPIDAETGAIAPQVADPDVIADTGAGWVRLNFHLGPWDAPTDRTQHGGHDWETAYRTIVDGLRSRDLQLYGLIGNEAVRTNPGDQFRSPPADGETDSPWLDEYVDAFVTILTMFHEDVQIVESFNEPDDWHGATSNWIHPAWFAIMLQKIYTAVKRDPELSHVTLVSGPLQGLEINNNGAARYLQATYNAGRRRFGWGSDGTPFPFDGVGYHLYVHEGHTDDWSAQVQTVGATYDRYLAEMKRVTRDAEGSVKPLYISEMGWFTNGGREEFQARNLSLAVDRVVDDPDVALAVWFCTQDFGQPQENTYYGLYRKGDPTPENRKPAFATFRACCERVIAEAEEDAVADTSEETVPATLFPEDGRWTGIVTAAALNLRPGPGMEHEPITQLPHETAVEVLGEQNGWLYVDAPGHRGFVYHTHVARKTAPAARETAAATAGPEPARTEPAKESLAPAAQERIPAERAGDHRTIANTWNRYGGFLTTLADDLGIDPAVAVAVLAVESGGRGFDANGRMIVRFENHVFYDRWGERHPQKFAQHFRFNSERRWKDQAWRRDPNGPWRTFHGDQDAEWEVFTFARSLDETAAMQSISMGAPQIMGFNHAGIGYGTVQEMFAAFSAGERAQIRGLFDFIKARGGLQALRDHNYHRIATLYNGSGQAARYAALIRNGVSAFRQLRLGQPSFSVPPVDDPSPDEPVSFLPPPPAESELSELDPELAAAWREHIKAGFEHNNEMFSRILDAFMNPYYTTIWMYRILFGVGILSFVTAAGLSIWTGNPLFGLAFGGLSVAAFLSYFLSRPLRSLEENLEFITWLGVIYNSYWTRLAYMLNRDTVQTDIQAATDHTIAQIEHLIDRHAAMRGTRPGLRRNEER